MDLLGLFAKNSAVKALSSNKPGLFMMNPQEEALITGASFRRMGRNMVLVKPNLYQAQDVYNRLYGLLGDDVVLYAVEESLQVEAIASSPETNAKKLETLITLLESDKPVLCVTHAAAVVRYLPQPEWFTHCMLNIHTDETYDMETLKRQLADAGYRYAKRVDSPMTFSFRGEVIDVFSTQYEQPIRIEFFDDIVDSIRTFDAVTQRTTGVVDHITIAPATDLLFTEEERKQLETTVKEKLEKDKKGLDQWDGEELESHVYQDLDMIAQHSSMNSLYKYRCFLDNQATVLDYIKNPYVVLSCKEEVKEHLLHVNEETIQYIRELYQAKKALLKFMVFAELQDVLAGKTTYEISKFEPIREGIRTHVHPVSLPELTLSLALQELCKEAKEHRVLLCLQQDGIRKVIDECMRWDIPYVVVGDAIPEVNGMYICADLLDEGFAYTEENLMVYTEKEIFATHRIRGRFASKFKEAQVLEDYTDLSIGDYVVHAQHGIGRYMGITTKEMDGIHRDYILIAYAGDDEWLVPLEQFQLVRKFIGSEGVHPKLSKLGSSEWKKTKERMKENVEEIAERLLMLYAAREQDIGYAFGPDNELQEDFENGFAYELTKDQAQSIEEVKQDMMSAKPMDRLLCGDVGFGKTEVALRAAFKAVLEHKQVAYLCPTTLLSRQHYYTFKKRLREYGVNVTLMNRLVDDSAKTAIKKGLKDGTVDIVIGTHRILSKDVVFRDLGLLIIDEEQRFGVEAKEKIKELKQGIDVLSLSATPIPRTLQLSLIGVRSLSQIQTPPNNRMPVQTYVIEKSETLMREVIQRELARNGQVFYLHNNTQTIYQAAKRIQELVPQATIAVAHGKMAKEEMEDVMIRFTENEYNILVCTTIIETGIDIPNANTILVDYADRFGLSQLYQIKGRVGRSDRLAYAYLMYDANQNLSETASKRLNAIKDFTELGSGYKIAMRDLAIRGAGDLLGAKQAGFINTVGMDLYIEMLHDAIAQKRGLPVENHKAVQKKASVKVDGYVPEKYAPEDYEKIRLYQRIEKAKTVQELAALEQEITDCYGQNPKSVQLLFDKRRMEVLIDTPKVSKFEETKTEAVLYISPLWAQDIDGMDLFMKLTNYSRDVKFKQEKGVLQLKVSKKLDWIKMCCDIVELLDTVKRK